MPTCLKAKVTQLGISTAADAIMSAAMVALCLQQSRLPKTSVGNEPNRSNRG